MRDKIRELIPTHIPSANEVKALRDSLKMGQPAFADAFNISIRTLQRYEKGATTMDAYMWEYVKQVVNAVRIEPMTHEVRNVEVDEWL